jgi:hypothetical protein
LTSWITFTNDFDPARVLRVNVWPAHAAGARFLLTLHTAASTDDGAGDDAKKSPAPTEFNQRRTASRG